MLRVEVRPATAQDVPAIARVLTEAAVYKAGHGDYLWGTEPYTDEEIAVRLAAGGLYAATCDGVVAGTVTLTDTDKRIWEADGTDPEYALYIHGLATGNAVRDNNVGGRIIGWVVEKARAEARQAVRLDCSYANPDLYDYYTRRGFWEIRRRDIPRKTTARDLRDRIYRAALLQRDVAN